MSTEEERAFDWYRVTRNEDLEPALLGAFAHEGPSLIEIISDVELI